MSQATLNQPLAGHGHAEGNGHGHGHHGHGHSPHLAHHFDSMDVQHNSAKLGMWLFLATEVLLFSGLFVAYAIFRAMHPEMFRQVSHLLDIKLGGLNTCVLIFSSLTMALAVRAAQTNNNKWLSINLVLTFICACGFLVVKYFEYTHKLHLGIAPGMWFHPNLSDPHVAEFMTKHGQTIENVRSFFSIYYMMTGLHGFHVVCGMIVIFWMWTRAIRGHFNSEYYYPVEVTGLYWHLVDLIWIYLFPLLYLVDRSSH